MSPAKPSIQVSGARSLSNAPDVVRCSPAAHLPVGRMSAGRQRPSAVYHPAAAELLPVCHPSLVRRYPAASQIPAETQLRLSVRCSHRLVSTSAKATRHIDVARRTYSQTTAISGPKNRKAFKNDIKKCHGRNRPQRLIIIKRLDGIRSYTDNS